MKFKFFLRIFIILLPLFVIFAGCKKATVKFEWDKLEGEGSYNSATDESYLSLSGFIKIDQSTVNINPINPAFDNDFLFVELLTWEYSVFSGGDSVLYISNQNVYDKFDKIFVNASDKTNDYLWVFVITETPVKGDIFNGKNPDSFEIVLQAVDDNGNYYRIVKTVDFKFTRN